MRDSQDFLVEFGPLVIAHLASLADGLADIPSSEVTHISSLSPALAVLVRKQLDSPSLDRALPALALGDADDIDLMAGLISRPSMRLLTYPENFNRPETFRKYL